jgi:uncharacterized Fe-S cluster protein YjdI
MRIHWNEHKCCHVGVCVKQLPAVFKVQDDEFIIDMEQASDEEIIGTAKQCPSGALNVLDPDNH